MLLPLLNSIPELLGLNVNQSKKLEINLTVDLVGHSELLKLCLIDYVSLQDKKIKPEFLLKTYCHAADFSVEMDVMEVTQVELGDIGFKPV